MSRAGCISSLVFLGVVLMGTLPGVNADPPVAHKHTNRLAQESSPYLRLHAHNPVDWYPWGPEALEKAKAEDKPIFLSIGYTSCFWCHVMERKVFENEAIATYLNEHFICIKVDREERPDLDDLYMLCLQVYLQLAGSDQGGGWPLSMFLTPDGKPIAGGTYFPPEDMPGRPGFPTVLKSIQAAWVDKRASVDETAALITKEVKRLSAPPLSLEQIPLGPELVEQVLEAVAAAHDPEHGGFDFSAASPDTPKFPIPSRLELLQTIGPFAESAPDLMRKLDMTLTRMEQGGLRDHLGGGFHRYSTDRQWLVPHFEKMLYDNAQLASVYTRAYARTSLKGYRQVAEGTLEFLLRDMRGPEGAFHAALDAESNGVEGQYYVWSPAEVATLLTKDESPIAEVVYGLNEKSPFEVGSVLHLPQSIPNAAEALRLPVGELEKRLAGINAKLLRAREQRPALLKDDKLMTDWNGLAIQAFAEAGQTFQRREYLDAAERTAKYLLTQAHSDDGRLLHVTHGGKAKIPAYLEDYTALIGGLLALHQATEDDRWLTEARRLIDEMIEQCADPRGGFFSTSVRHEELLARPKNAYDAVIPSGNSQAARLLVRVAKLTGDHRYRDSARKTFETFAPQISRSPAGYSYMAIGLAEYLTAFGEAGEAPTVAGTGLPKPVPQKTMPPKAVSPTKPVPMPQPVPVPGTDSPLLTVFARSTAEDATQHPLIDAEAMVDATQFAPGAQVPVVVRIRIKEGWHINANPAKPKFLKATELKAEFASGAVLGEVTYPAGTEFISEGFEEPLSVYEGTVELHTTIQVPADFTGKQDAVSLTIRYQACNSNECQPPGKLLLKGTLERSAKP